MQIIEKQITELKPYERNPRINDNAVKYVANSIKEFGWKVPIVIDKNNVIVAGIMSLLQDIHAIRQHSNSIFIQSLALSLTI